MTLHEAILQVMREKGRTMNAIEIAEEINLQQLYRRQDGKPLEPSQVRARISRYRELFSDYRAS